MNLDMEQICPAWKFTTWHVDTKHGQGLQSYLKLLKYYLKTSADLTHHFIDCEQIKSSCVGSRFL